MGFLSHDNKEIKLLSSTVGFKKQKCIVTNHKNYNNFFIQQDSKFNEFQFFEVVSSSFV